MGVLGQRLVREDPADKVTFEWTPERGEGEGHVHV